MRVIITTGTDANYFSSVILKRLDGTDADVAAVLSVRPTFPRVVEELLTSGLGPVKDRARRARGRSPEGSVSALEWQQLNNWAATWGVNTASVKANAEASDIQVVPVRDLTGSKTTRIIQSLQCDVLLYGGGGYVGPSVIESCGRVINGHSGPLPAIRGMSAAEWAVLTGNPLEGTVHEMTPEFDRGSVLARAPILPHAASTGHLRAAALESLADVIIETLAGDSLPPSRPVDHTRGKTYFRMHPRLWPLVDAYLSKSPPRLAK